MGGREGLPAGAIRPSTGRSFSGLARRTATPTAAISPPTAIATAQPALARRLDGSGSLTRGSIFGREGRPDGAGVGSSTGISRGGFATATLARRPAGRASGPGSGGGMLIASAVGMPDPWATDSSGTFIGAKHPGQTKADLAFEVAAEWILPHRGQRK